MYAVVETNKNDESREVCVVLQKWVIGNTLHWPGQKNYTKTMKRRLSFEEEWETYPCKVLNANISKLYFLKV